MSKKYDTEYFSKLDCSLIISAPLLEIVELFAKRIFRGCKNRHLLLSSWYYNTLKECNWDVKASIKKMKENISNFKPVFTLKCFRYIEENSGLVWKTLIRFFLDKKIFIDMKYLGAKDIQCIQLFLLNECFTIKKRKLFGCRINYNCFSFNDVLQSNLDKKGLLDFFECTYVNKQKFVPVFSITYCPDVSRYPETDYKLKTCKEFTTEKNEHYTLIKCTNRDCKLVGFGWFEHEQTRAYLLEQDGLSFDKMMFSIHGYNNDTKKAKKLWNFDIMRQLQNKNNKEMARSEACDIFRSYCLFRFEDLDEA